MKKNIVIILIFLVLACIAGWLIINNSSTTLKKELKDFAVADTSAIDKIYLADRRGNSVLLERKAPGKWTVNGKYEARNSNINSLLYTIKVMEVRSPVGKNLYNNTMKLMAATAVKTEIYQHGELVKTYYVGHSTMDNLGTFMYLEGSSVPFIMHIPGFNGYLTTRYPATVEEWKEHNLLRFDPKTITNVKVENFSASHRSFEIIRNPDSTYAINLLVSNKQLSPFDPAKLRTYLKVFQSVNYERIDTHVNAFQHDSLVKAGPFAKVYVRNDKGKEVLLQLYRHPVNDQTKNPFDKETGIPYRYDMDKFAAQIQGDTTWYLCQYYHFDPVLKDPQNFLPGQDKTSGQKRD